MTKNVEKNEVQLKKNPLFELIINNPSQASPDLAFTWCINPEALERLERDKVFHPYLLVCAFKDTGDGETYRDYRRVMYPLKNGMGHINFGNPGKFKVHASVIWSTYHKQKDEGKDARKHLFESYLQQKKMIKNMTVQSMMVRVIYQK